MSLEFFYFYTPVPINKLNISPISIFICFNQLMKVIDFGVFILPKLLDFFKFSVLLVQSYKCYLLILIIPSVSACFSFLYIFTLFFSQAHEEVSILMVFPNNQLYNWFIISTIFLFLICINLLMFTITFLLTLPFLALFS
jgi:hypothetical protein